MALVSALFVAAADGRRWRPRAMILVPRGVCRRHPRIRRRGSERGWKVGFFGCFVWWLCMHSSFFGRFVVGVDFDGGVSCCVIDGVFE